jgi:hypothetical protein
VARLKLEEIIIKDGKTERIRMKTTGSKVLTSSQTWLVAALIGLTSVKVVAALPPTTPAGYLAKSDPLGLRFAQPPKMPLASLPPRAIPSAAPAAFIADYVAPENPSRGILANAPRSAQTENSEPTLRSAADAPSIQPKASTSPGASPLVETKMLVKFFTNSKPSTVLTSEPIIFQTPSKNTTP